MMCDDVLPRPEVRRIEVFTGAGRPRRSTVEAKARIRKHVAALRRGFTI
jgi:hypothetical protein